MARERIIPYTFFGMRRFVTGNKFECAVSDLYSTRMKRFVTHRRWSKNGVQYHSSVHTKLNEIVVAKNAAEVTANIEAECSRVLLPSAKYFNDRMHSRAASKLDTQKLNYVRVPS